MIEVNIDQKGQIMQIVTNLEEAIIRSSNSEKICWAIHRSNRWDIFKICYFQFKHKARDEFKCIYYQKSKDILYYTLKMISFLGLNHYQVVYDYKL